MPLSNFRDRRRGVLVLVLVEERSAARQQNFVRSPQIAMRPFSTANAAHTRRKFSTIVKIFAKSEQDPNSKLVALVFSLLQTDETLVNFCQLYFFGSWAEGKLIKLTRFRMLQWILEVNCEFHKGWAAFLICQIFAKCQMYAFDPQQRHVTIHCPA